MRPNFHCASSPLIHGAISNYFLWVNYLHFQEALRGTNLIGYLKPDIFLMSWGDFHTLHITQDPGRDLPMIAHLVKGRHQDIPYPYNYMIVHTKRVPWRRQVATILLTTEAQPWMDLPRV